MHSLKASNLPRAPKTAELPHKPLLKPSPHFLLLYLRFPLSVPPQVQKFPPKAIFLWFSNLPIEYFFTSAAETVVLHEQTREDFYFLEPCAVGIAEGVVGHQKPPSESNSADQFTLSCRQVIRGLVTLLCEKQASCGLGKDSRFENSFLLDWDNNSSYLSCGTNKGPDNTSFDQPKHDKLLFSGSQDPKDSMSHIDNRNAAVCILRAGELFCATNGDAQLLMIRFNGKIPELVPLPAVKTAAPAHKEPGTEILKEVIKKEAESANEDSMTFTAKITDKDLLLLGSANLFSNVSSTSILGAVKEHVEKQGFHEFFAQAIAKEIANLANAANTMIPPTSFDVGKNEDVTLFSFNRGSKSNKKCRHQPTTI